MDSEVGASASGVKFSPYSFRDRLAAQFQHRSQRIYFKRKSPLFFRTS